MGKQILGSDKIIRLNGFSLIGLVQSLDSSPTLNVTEITELGRQSRVDASMELETSGSFELEASGGTAGLLARMIPRRVGGAFSSFLYSGSGTGSNKNAYTIDETMITEMQFDMVVYERPDQTNFSRSGYFPRCFVNTVSGKIDSSGMGTETIAWSGEEEYGFDTPFHDILATPFTRTSPTSATSIDATVNSGYTLVYFHVDEKRYRTVNTDANFVTAVTGVVTITGGDTIPTDAICRGVFYKTTAPSSTFPSLVDAQRGTVAFYLKGWQADVFLDVADVNNPATAEKLLKVQSADYSIEFNLEPLRQIALNPAGTSVYCRVPTTPFKISFSCSMYESDWNEWKRLFVRGGASSPKFPSSGNTVYTDSYDFLPANLKGDSTNPLTAAVRQYTKNGNTLQTLQFPDLYLDSYSNRVNVGGRAEVALGFKGTRFAFVGANPAS